MDKSLNYEKQDLQNKHTKPILTGVFHLLRQTDEINVVALQVWIGIGQNNLRQLLGTGSLEVLRNSRSVWLPRIAPALPFPNDDGVTGHVGTGTSIHLFCFSAGQNKLGTPV